MSLIDLISFYGGVLCLVALLLTFVWLQEALVIGISMTVLVVLSIIMPPLLYHCGYTDMRDEATRPQRLRNPV